MQDSIQTIHAFKVNMSGILLDQALPAPGIDQVDPFLLLHHWKGHVEAGSRHSDIGVGPHPHRGFSPVTFIVEGEILHQDSRSNRALTKSGGVQWMNAGMGIIHSERPSAAIAEKGGDFEIIQIWINTPASHKMDQPEYFSKENDQLEEIALGSNSKLHLISGRYDEITGPVNSKSPMQVAWLQGSIGDTVQMKVNSTWNSMFYVVQGGVKVEDQRTFSKELVILPHNSSHVDLSFTANTLAIWLSGEPLNEPKVSQGPFVMNTETEILQAIRDYQQGKMGFLVEELN